MQPILEAFLENWVYPTGFSGPGVDFRLRQTERCLPLWDKLVSQALQFADNDLKSGSDEYKAVRARAGYAAEGPFMSLKQMSTQILSVAVDEHDLKWSAETAKGFDTDRVFVLMEIAGEQLYFQAVSRTGQVVDSGILEFQRRPDAASSGQ